MASGGAELQPEVGGGGGSMESAAAAAEEVLSLLREAVGDENVTVDKSE